MSDRSKPDGASASDEVLPLPVGGTAAPFNTYETTTTDAEPIGPASRPPISLDGPVADSSRLARELDGVEEGPGSRSGRSDLALLMAGETESASSETRSVVSDLAEQASQLNDDVIQLPLEIARETAGSWALTLRSLTDPKLEPIVRSLEQLERLLAGRMAGAPESGGDAGAGDASGEQLMACMNRMAEELGGLAEARVEPMSGALERLGEALRSAGRSVVNHTPVPPPLS